MIILAISSWEMKICAELIERIMLLSFVHRLIGKIVLALRTFNCKLALARACFELVAG